MTYKTIRNLMRIYRLCAEIEARHPPQPSDCMTIQEFGRLLVDELSRALSLRVARRWAREHLRPAQCKHPRSLAGWQERFERDKPKRSITQDEFAQVLTDVGVRVAGDEVYFEEIEA